MRKLFIVTAIIVLFTSLAHCEENKAVNKSPFSFLQGFVMGDNYVQYQSELTKIEDSYKKGEITKEQYHEMKEDAKKSYNSTKI